MLLKDKNNCPATVFAFATYSSRADFVLGPRHISGPWVADENVSHIFRLPDFYCQGYSRKIMSLVVALALCRNRSNENDKDIIYLQLSCQVKSEKAWRFGISDGRRILQFGLTTAMQISGRKILAVGISAVRISTRQKK